MAAIPLPHEPEIEYPESDGKPMAESDVHQAVMMHLIQGLRDHYSTEPEVYVAGNLLLYDEEGKRVSVAPDVFVVRGVPKRRRDTYLLWREGQAPCFVLEVTLCAHAGRQGRAWTCAQRTLPSNPALTDP